MAATEKQKANLIPYKMKPGQTLNPNGRPKGVQNRSTVARELLEVMTDVTKYSPKNAAALRKMGLPVKASMQAIITAAQIVKAVQGDTRAYEALMDSGFGRAPQSIDHTTKGDKVTLPRVTLTKE